MLEDSRTCKHFIDPKLFRGVESIIIGYTEINSPIEIKAAGHNILFGTAQAILLGLVKYAQDVCRTVKLPIVLVPKLGIFFPQLSQLKKVSKRFSLRQGRVDHWPWLVFSSVNEIG